MKKKHIIAGLIALALITSASIASVAATIYPYLIVERKGKIYTFTINNFNGDDVILSSIVATVYDRNNKPIILTQEDIVGVFTSDTILELKFANNALPSNHATAVSLEGALHSGDTFLASGPGWGWGGHY